MEVGGFFLGESGILSFLIMKKIFYDYDKNGQKIATRKLNIKNVCKFSRNSLILTWNGNGNDIHRFIDDWCDFGAVRSVDEIAFYTQSQWFCKIQSQFYTQK